MRKFMMEPVSEAASEEILDDITLSFEENLIGENSINCDPYGCTCIAHEKCCGCLLQ